MDIIVTALEAALRYAAEGRFVFPCNVATKRPRTPHGLLDASRDESVIREWWTAEPNAAIGMRTGAVSGLVVLDIDGDNGEDSLIELQRVNGPLPVTVEVLTPHGRHMHFAYPSNVSLVRCAVAFRGLPGLDVRGDGGYAIVPPSQGYFAELSSTSEFAVMPAMLIDVPRVALSAVDQPIPRGTRNTALASLGGTMRGRGMSEAAIRAALIADNLVRCQPPLPDEEVIRIAQSVSRYSPNERIEIRGRSH